MTQLALLLFGGDTLALTTTQPPKGPTMPKAPPFAARPTLLERFAEWRDRRRARHILEARRQLVAAIGADHHLNANDIATIRYALDDRARIHQGTPAGEAARITRQKLTP